MSKKIEMKKSYNCTRKAVFWLPCDKIDIDALKMYAHISIFEAGTLSRPLQEKKSLDSNWDMSDQQLKSNWTSLVFFCFAVRR